MRTWLDAATKFAHAHEIADHDVDLLRCFAGPEPRGGPPPPPEEPWDGDFESLERLRLADSLDGIAAVLEPEVDRAQARLFARRLNTVDQALAALGDDFGRLLRVGLRQRVRGVLASTHARPTRIRALADFYFSYVGLHRHRRSGSAGQSLEAMLRDLRWQTVIPGLEHATLDGRGARGPMHVNLLRVDPRRVRFEAEDCRPSARKGTPFAAHVAARGAIAGISGGFFLYSEPDIEPPSQRFDPVGLLVREGRVLSPPAFARGGLVFDADGRPSIGRIGMTDVTIQARGQARGQAPGQTPGQAPGGLRWRPESVTNRARTRQGPDELSMAVVGDQVVAVGRSLPVPLNGFVLPVPEGLAPSPGDRLQYSQVQGPTGPVHHGIAGGPVLLDDGQLQLQMQPEDFWGSAPPITFSQDETGDRNLLPRLAAGLTEDGQLVLAAIDGRNFDRALGMTLADTGRMLRALGCTIATNLDGGSSKRMVLNGRALDLASTEIIAEGVATVSVRPVHTALLLFARDQ